MNELLDSHKVSFSKSKTHIDSIVNKYNKKHGTNLTNWRSMDLSRVCMTDQKYLISYLKRKGGAKVPDTGSIFDRLMHDMRTKKDPTLVEYLLNKGKSEEDIAVYLGVEVSALDTHHFDEGNGGIDGGSDEVGEVNTEGNLLFAEGEI